MASMARVNRGRPLLWAHPGRIGGSCARVVGTVPRRTIGPALHAAIYILAAAGGLHAKTLPRRKFNASIVCASLRRAQRQGHQAHGNDGGGSDEDAHDFSSCIALAFPEEINSRVCMLAIERRFRCAIPWYKQHQGHHVRSLQHTARSRCGKPHASEDQGLAR